jgi:uncharacterized membrane protein
MLFLIWLHLMAAVTWIGGMLFLSLVLIPALRREGMDRTRADVLKAAGKRFRVLVWVAVLVLLVSGPFLLAGRGLSLLQPDRWPAVLTAKLGLVGVIILLTALHDLILGPRMTDRRQSTESAQSALRAILVRSSAWVPRLSVLIALAILWLAVLLARLDS